MLAQEANIKDLVDYCHDGDYWLEQKLDGHRILLDCNKDSIVAKERKGNPSQHNTKFQTNTWHNVVSQMEGRAFVLDGEYIAGEYWVFDLPYCDGIVYPSDPYAVRRSVLETAAKRVNLNLVPCARDTDAKLDLVERCIKSHSEGVMIKNRYGEYYSGLRTSHCLKAKFTRTADLIVTAKGIGGKENLTLCAWQDGQLVEVGRCSSIGKPKVELGSVIEVEYLYLSEKGHRLVQPRFKKTRPDKEMQECHFSQLIPTDKTVLLQDG